MALAPAILSYWVSGGHLWVVPAYLLMACALAGLVAATLSLAVGIAARFAGPGRAELIGATGRGLLLAGTFLGFALCMRHSAAPPTTCRSAAGRRSAGPAIGARGCCTTRSAPGASARRWSARVWVLYVALALLQRAPRSTAARGRRVGWLARLDRRLVGDGPLLALTAFTSALLYRSAGFRAKALPILGLPAAMVGLTMWDAPAAHRMILLGVALQLPAAYMPLLVAFLPEADEEGTRWIFTTCPADTGPELARRAALVSLSTHVLLPAQLVAAVVLLFSDIAVVPLVALVTFSFGASVLVTAVALRELPCIPFTDETEGTSIEMQSLIWSAVVMAIVGACFAVISPNLWALIPGVALTVVAFRLLRWRPAHA